MTYISRGYFTKLLESKVNLTEADLESGTLPLAAGSIILQDSPEHADIVLLTFLSPSEGYTQIPIRPKFLDIDLEQWAFDIEGPMTLEGPNHKTLTFTPSRNFQLVSIATTFS